MEKLTKINKIKIFCKEKKEYLISLGVVLILFNLMLAICGCFPYGSKTIGMADTISQIGSFFEHIYNVFEGDSTLMYSNEIAGGFEIFSSLEYMLLNPFYLILFLGGKNNIFNTLSFSVMFMFLFNAVVFVWFAKKHFPNVKPYVRVLLSVLFAFSPYVAANFIFVTWLIYPGIFLILIDKFLKLVREGKILGFVCVLVWYVCTCFSVGVSTNIILILLFSAFIFFVVEKQEQKQALVRLFVAYIIAVLASVIILLPGLIALMGAPSRALNFKDLFEGDYPHQTEARLTFIFLLGIFLIVSIFHLARCNKKDGKNKFYILACSVSATILIFGMVNDLLCGGTCNGLYYRFGFIFICIILIVSLEFFNANYEFKPKEESHMSLYKIIYFLFISLILFITIWWCVMCYQKFGIGISWITIFLVSALILVFIIVCLMRKKGLIPAIFYKVFIIMSMVITITINFVYASSYTGTNYNHKTLKQITSELNTNSKIKICTSLLTSIQINSLDLGVKNSSVFSSLIPSEIIESYANLDYLVSKVSVEITTGNLIADSLTGQKYFASYVEIDMPYLKLLEHKGDYYLYENTLATTGAVVLEKDFAFDKDLTEYENFEKLRSSLGISGTLFSDIQIQKESVEYDKRYANFVTKYTYTASESGYIYTNKRVVTLDRIDNKDFNAYFDELVGSKQNFYVENMNNVSKSELVFVEKGETVEFYLSGVGNQASKTDEDITFTFLNHDVAVAVCKELQSRDVEIEYSKNGWNVNLNGESGKLVVFSVDIDGMNYKVNGKTAKAGHEFGYFVAFEVDENTKGIEAYYKYPHTFLWIAVTILCILLIVVIAVLYKKTKFKFLEKIVYYAFIVANCCIMLVFVDFGIILTIFRIIL